MTYFLVSLQTRVEDGLTPRLDDIERQEVLCDGCIAWVQKHLDFAAAKCADGHGEYKGAQSDTAQSPGKLKGATCEKCNGVVEKTVSVNDTQHFFLQKHATTALALARVLVDPTQGAAFDTITDNECQFDEFEDHRRKYILALHDLNKELIRSGIQRYGPLEMKPGPNLPRRWHVEVDGLQIFGEFPAEPSEEATRGSRVAGRAQVRIVNDPSSPHAEGNTDPFPTQLRQLRIATKLPVPLSDGEDPFPFASWEEPFSLADGEDPKRIIVGW